MSARTLPAGYLGYEDFSEIRNVSLDGSGEQVIAAATGQDEPWMDSATWSPDGSSLAYTRGSDVGTYQTWLYDPRSGEHRQVGAGEVQTWLDDHTVLVGT